MTQHPDHHERDAHEHGPGCDHGHDHAAPLDLDKMDASQRSLADALRMSFKLLSVIMLLTLVALLLTGLRQIQSGTVGVRLQFGRIAGEGDGRVITEGLTWSLPEPLGKILVVNTGPRKLDIRDFWFNVPVSEALKPLSEMNMPAGEQGLQPGLDGALLTGDRGLCHVQLICTYSVGTRTGKVDPESVINFITNVQDEEETVRSAIANAAIHAAATRTVDSLITAGQSEFAEAVRQRAQQQLNRLSAGIEVTSVGLSLPTPPLAARAAFENVTKARQERDNDIKNAMGEYVSILQGTVGDSWQPLAGDPSAPGGLLRQYAQAREQKNQPVADDMGKQIDSLLDSARTSGETSTILSEARSYRSGVTQNVQGRVEHFLTLLNAYEKAPDLTLSELWNRVRADLSNRRAEIYYVPNSQRLTLRINRDPEVVKNLAAEAYKAKAEGKGPGN